MAGRERGERIDSEDLGRKVYRALKSMIIDGELASGEKLAQERLAARLGVSRTPLLSALSRLEQENLVRTVPRRGAFVRSYTGEELLDIYDIRCRLEPLGARDAALAATPADLATLRRMLADFDAAAAANDDHALKRADFAFHMELMRCSGNRFLYDMLSTFNIIIIANTSGLLKPAEQSDREHHELLEALEAHDAQRADRVMFEHLSGARANLLQRLRTGREG